MSAPAPTPAKSKLDKATCIVRASEHLIRARRYLYDIDHPCLEELTSLIADLMDEVLQHADANQRRKRQQEKELVSTAG